ncbi:MAG: methylase [Syntrophus sp. (in: bacteria)]|nr:methylase [Syntrophus sp. (in: bacteria)]
MFINPFYFARKGLYENISALASKITGDVLDIGCGQKPYQHLIRAEKYIGLELDTPQNRVNKKADIFYDGHRFPFEDNEFDSVVVNAVLEHVFNPKEFLAEINRVLKPGGALLATAPFVWDEHEQPYDYARYSSFGLKHLIESHGFTVVEQRKSIHDIRVIFQLLNAYTYKKTVTNNWYINLVTTMVLIAPVTLLGILLNYFLPGNSDLYLDNCVLAQKNGN